MLGLLRGARRSQPLQQLFSAIARGFSEEVPKARIDPLHLPDSFLGLQEQPVEIDKEVFQQYHCYPTLDDVKFIKCMVSVLRGGAITWWEAGGILKRFNVRLQPFHICEILKKNLDPDASMGLFRWAQSHPGFTHDSNTYNIMLRIMGTNQNFRDLQALLKEMKGREIRPTYVTFMNVVQSYFEAAKVDKAMETFLEFEKCVKPKPKMKYYRYVLARLIEVKRSEWLPTVITGMLQVGYLADTETFNVVIQGLCTTGKLQAAIDLSRQMIDKGCIPDAQTYVYLLSGLVAAPKSSLELVDDIIQEMCARGCKPNVHNFNLLLEFLLGSDMALEMLGVVEKLVSSGCCQLQSSSQRIVVSFLAERGDAVLALGFFEGLARHDVYPDLATYNSLLRLLNGIGEEEKAVELHRGMRCPADIETKNIILQVLCKLGRGEEAMEMFRGLKKLRLRPTKVTYDVLLLGLAVNGKLVECLRVMKKMEKHEFAPEEATYASVIEALSVGGLHDQAFRLFGRMKLEGLALSVEQENAMILRRRRCLEAQQ